jgi:CubicO group peptidase (beta-lactamase class C family)
MADETGPGVTETQRQHVTFDLATWAEVDDPFYAFTHASEFFAHAVIHRDGPIAPLSDVPLGEIGAITAQTPLGSLPLDDYLDRAPVDGFAVAHRGRLVYERYPRMRPLTKHLLWSVGKTFPAAVIAQLEDEGRLDVTDPVEVSLPELAGTAWAGTPVIDILDMASGMAGLEADDPGAYVDPTSRYYRFEASLGMLPLHTDETESTYAYVAALPRLRPCGEAFEYSSVNTFVLAWLAEWVLGRPFAELVSTRIWGRIGAEADALMILSDAGAPACHGGISATLRDLVRWGLCFTPSQDLVTSEPVVSDAYLRKIQTGGNPARFARWAETRGESTPLRSEARHNTYQWDVVTTDGDFFKGGYRGQGLYISPRRELVLAFVGIQDVGQLAYASAIARSGLFGT